MSFCLHIKDSESSNLLNCQFCPGACIQGFCFYDLNFCPYNKSSNQTNYGLIIQDTISFGEFSALEWFVCSNKDYQNKINPNNSKSEGVLSIKTLFSRLRNVNKGLKEQEQTSKSSTAGKGGLKTLSFCQSVLGGYMSFNELNKPTHIEEIKYLEYFDHQYPLSNQQANNQSTGNHYYYQYYPPITTIENLVLNINSAALSNKEVMVFPLKSASDKDNKPLKAVIDSQSNYSFLKEDLYDTLLDKLFLTCFQSEQACLDTSKELISLDPTKNETLREKCFKLSNKDSSLKVFLLTMPDILIKFNHDFTYTWKPQSYFYRRNEELVCLTIRPLKSASVKTGEDVILGKSFFTNYDIIFDFEKERIGITKADCLLEQWNSTTGKVNNSSAIDLSILLLDDDDIAFIKSSDAEDNKTSIVKASTTMLNSTSEANSAGSSSEGFKDTEKLQSEVNLTYVKGNYSVNTVNNTTNYTASLGNFNCSSKYLESKVLNSEIGITLALLLIFLFISFAFSKFKNGDDFLCIPGMKQLSARYKEVKIPVEIKIGSKT